MNVGSFWTALRTDVALRGKKVAKRIINY